MSQSVVARLGFILSVIFTFKGQLVTGICTEQPLTVVKKVDGTKREICEYKPRNSNLTVEVTFGSKIKTENCFSCECLATSLKCCTPEIPDKASIPFGCTYIRDGCDYHIVLATNKTKTCVEPTTIPTPVTTDGFLLSPTTDLLGSGFNAASSLTTDPSLVADLLVTTSNPLYDVPLATDSFLAPTTTLQNIPIPTTTQKALLKSLVDILRVVAQNSRSPSSIFGGFGGRRSKKMDLEAINENPILAMHLMNSGALGGGLGGGAGGASGPSGLLTGGLGGLFGGGGAITSGLLGK